MLDNLFSGTLLAGLAALGAVAVLSAASDPPRPAWQQTAAAPMPVYQLPRVVVRGHVMREPALLADGAAGMAPRSAPTPARPGHETALP